MPDPIDAAGLRGAFNAALELLSRGTKQDLEHGPAWRSLSRDSITAHLVKHIGELIDGPQRIDDATGCLTAAHVAVRSLMLLQLAVEARRGEHRDNV